MTDPNVSTYVAKTEDGHLAIGSNTLPAGLFPAIEFHQIGGSDREFSDDEVEVREYRFQVTIFSQDSSHYLVDNELDRVMRQLGFICYFDHEMRDENLKVTSRILLYQIYLNQARYSAMERLMSLTETERKLLNNI